MYDDVASVESLMQELQQEMRGNRYLAAFSSLQKLEQMLQLGKSSPVATELAQEMLFKYRDEIATLRSRYHEVINLAHPQDNPAQWLLGSQQHGVTTHYQINSTSNTLLLKMESVLEGVSLMDIIAVTQEVDLFPLWLPACNECLLVNRIDHSEILFYLSISVLSIMRDVAIHWYGVDCLQENNKLLLVGKSVTQHPTPAPMQPTPIPFKARSWLHDRFGIPHFQAICEVLSPNSTKLTLVADIDPNSPLPSSLLSFVLKQVAGKVLHCFYRQAQKIGQDPHCAHAVRIREKTSFYADWMEPKLRNLYTLRRWDCPLYFPLSSSHSHHHNHDNHSHHHSHQHSHQHSTAPPPSSAVVPVSPAGRVGAVNMKIKCADLVRRLEQEGIDVSEEDLNFDCLYIC